MLDNFQLVGETVRLLALNDYGVDMPMADIRRMRPLLATRADGVPLPRRDKGPIFVMFDFDGLDKPEGKLASSYAVWQLRSIGLR